MADDTTTTDGGAPASAPPPPPGYSAAAVADANSVHSTVLVAPGGSVSDPAAIDALSSQLARQEAAATLLARQVEAAGGRDALVAKYGPQGSTLLSRAGAAAYSLALSQANFVARTGIGAAAAPAGPIRRVVQTPNPIEATREANAVQARRFEANRPPSLSPGRGIAASPIRSSRSFLEERLSHHRE